MEHIQLTSISRNHVMFYDMKNDKNIKVIITADTFKKVCNLEEIEIVNFFSKEISKT